MSREELSNKIKKWVTLDNEIKELNSKVSELRDERSVVSEDILDYVNEAEISHATIKISDGTLKFVDTKQYQSLSLKFIENCLNELDDHILDKKNIKEIMDFIKNKREMNVTSSIKRTYNKEE